MYLGIELGSTRIKAMVLNKNYKTVASGSFIWQTKEVGGYWTYDLEDVWKGLKEVIKTIAKSYDLSQIEAMGVSAMMHGYLPFDENDELLTPFRTWKNENTAVAAKELSELFNFNIPLRWSISHLYQAYLDKEPSVHKVKSLTTLAAYVHACLSGQKVIGIGDASGMFPIDIKTQNYDQAMIDQFEKKTGLKISELLPRIVRVGEDAGALTLRGQQLLGDSRLRVGIPLAAPEGDAQTGMVATNSLAPKTGNVSAGTSVFSMVVLNQELKNWYQEIDIVQTPLGDTVAMVHANECTSRIDPWIELFGEASAKLGLTVGRDTLFETMYELALDPNSKIGRFMHQKLVDAISDLKVGIDILLNKEKIDISYLYGHGGYFKSKSAGRIVMSETLGIPIKLLKTAGEGGPWGMAVLAAFRYQNKFNRRDFSQFMKEIFKGE